MRFVRFFSRQRNRFDNHQPPKRVWHGAEYAGIWTAPETTYAEFEKNTQRAHDGCRGVIAKWAKIPNDGNLKFRTGTIIYFPTEVEWNNGDRGVQCFAWISDQKLRGSGKGAGPGYFRIR